jgi:CubicO group peptidase (beta-lactamase class C family)
VCSLCKRRSQKEVELRTFIALAATLLAVSSCASHGTDARIQQRIRAVENGLVEFSTPADVFRAGAAEADTLMTLAARMGHYKVPGVSIAVVNDFAPEWAKAYGVLKTGADTPVTPVTYFQAASTSKLVAAAVVLHYVGKGVLSLDEDVNSYLKSWRLPESEFTKQQKVTLRLLLTHQAGLPATNFPRQEDAGEPTLVQVLNGESPAMNKPAVVEQLPGTKWQYSNIGYVVIQQILEDVLGKPYTLIARETVFEPLKMKNSTFVYPLEPELRAREAMPHDADGILREPALSSTAVAQGGMITTPTDLAAFAVELMRAYRGSSNRLLSREAARLMFSMAADLDPAMFGVALSQGLGPLLHGEGDRLVFLLPGSNFPGMNCWLLGYLETGKGIAVMTNGAMGEVLAMEIISAFNREYVPAYPAKQ